METVQSKTAHRAPTVQPAAAQKTIQRSAACADGKCGACCGTSGALEKQGWMQGMESPSIRRFADAGLVAYRSAPHIARQPMAAQKNSGAHEGSKNVSPWQVGWEWLTGDASHKERHFGAGDRMTEQLKKHEGLVDARRRARSTIEIICRVNPGATQVKDDKGIQYSLGGVGGVYKYVRDYSTLFTFGATGNLTGTFLGSYNGKWTAHIDCCRGAGTIHFHIKNTSGLTSATHFPILGYDRPRPTVVDWLTSPVKTWKNWGATLPGSIDKDRASGPMSNVTQIFDWDEPITFTPPKDCAAHGATKTTSPSGAPAQKPLEKVKVWLNAFIPKNVPGKSKPAPGQHKGKTMLPGPIPYFSDCFLTDNRGFSNDIGASSRMHSEIEIAMLGPKSSGEWHHCTATHEIDCEDGDAECTKEGGTSRMKFSNLRDADGAVLINIKGAANNPCAVGSPDIDYEGTIAIHAASRRVAFDGKIDEFPAFEMYAAADGGAGAILFGTMPQPGKDPWNLFGGANRKQQGSATL